jgi:hypothetical protein
MMPPIVESSASPQRPAVELEPSPQLLRSMSREGASLAPEEIEEGARGLGWSSLSSPSPQRQESGDGSNQRNSSGTNCNDPLVVACAVSSAAVSGAASSSEARREEMSSPAPPSPSGRLSLSRREEPESRRSSDHHDASGPSPPVKPSSLGVETTTRAIAATTSERPGAPLPKAPAGKSCCSLM